jgi:biopolymer transport protein ExbB/TolQ
MDFRNDEKYIVLVLIIIMTFGIVLHVQNTHQNKRFLMLEERISVLEEDKRLSDQKIKSLREADQSSNKQIITNKKRINSTNKKLNNLDSEEE